MTEAELRRLIGAVILEHASNDATMVRHALAEVVAVFILSHCRQHGSEKQIKKSTLLLFEQFVKDIAFALRELPKARERAEASETRQ